MSDSDQDMHLWARALPLDLRPARGYAACGVHIGRFTQKIEEVNCAICLEIANTKKRIDEPTQPVSQ